MDPFYKKKDEENKIEEDPEKLGINDVIDHISENKKSDIPDFTAEPVHRSDISKEQKEKIEQMLPAEVFEGKKSGIEKAARMVSCTQLLTALFAGFLIISLGVLFWSIGFIQNDLLADEPVAVEPITITNIEKESLQTELKKYNMAVEESKKTLKPIDVNLTLTGNQVNYLFSTTKNINIEKTSSKIQIFPENSKARILVSVPFNNKKYVNVTMEGVPEIDNYRFRIEPDIFTFGKLKRAMFMKEKITARINRELNSEPERLGLPMRIKKMEIKDSKINLVITVKSQV